MSAGFRRLPCFRKVISRSSIVVLAIPMLVSAAFAQSQSGTVVGLIQDPQHKLIPGVEVQLSRVDASQPISHTITDTAGRFKFVGLSAGVYSLELTLPGWQGQHLSQLNIDAARTLDIYIVLIPALPTIINKQNRSLQLLDRDVLVGRQFGQVSLRKLPNTRRIWSLLENQVISTVTDRLDTGGLETGRRALFGARGVSWTENQYSLNGF